MANVKINDLAVIAAPASTDVLPIVDVTLDTTNKISIADILKTAPEGTAAAPAIAFEGDSNTGIYHPGSEQIGFATSGFGRLFIASDGNVGIGTSDPDEPLHIASATPTILLEDTSGATAGIERTAFARVNDSLFIQSRGNDNAGVSVDYRIDYNSSGASSHQWRIGNSEKMRIDSSGNVGIGTSSPRTKLHVTSSNLSGAQPRTSATATFESNGSTELYLVSPNDTNGQIRFGDTDSNYRGAINYRHNTDSLDFVTSGTERLRIDSNGNVGIGTSNPGRELHVVGANNVIRAESTGTAARIEFEDSNTTAVGAVSLGSVTDDMQFVAGSAERMRISSTGNVGIGTTNPAALLHLAANAPYITFEDKDNNQDWQLQATAWFALRNQTAASELLRVDAAGNVGIGTTIPQVALDVEGQTNNAFTQGFNLRLTDTRTAAQGVGSGISFRGKWNTASPTAVADFAVITGIKENNTDGNYAGALILGTRTAGTGAVNTERMRISSTGNVGIGTTDPGATLHVNSAGQATSSIDTATSIQQIISDSGNTVNSGGSIVFAANNGNWRFAAIKGLVSNGNNNTRGDLTFSVRNLVTDSTLSEAMRISSEGNVGIGTSSPDELLHIEGNLAEFKGTNTNAISDTAGTEQVFKFGIEGQKNNVYGPAGSIIFRQDGSSWSSVEVNQKPTRIEFCTQDSTASDTSESPRMVIDQDGNVGIGTSNPQARLDIRTSAGTDCQLFLNEATTTNAFQIKQTSTEARIQTTASQPLVIAGQGGLGSTSDIRFETRDNERMRITSNGNVGIGTSDPIDLLSVGSSTSADQRISLFSNATTQGEAYGSILFRFSSANGNKNAKISALRTTNSSGSALAFYTRTPGDAVNNDGGLERMRIGSDGRININTGGSDISVNSGTNDGLTIYDTGSPSAGVIQTSTNGGPAMYLRRRTSDGSIIVFFRDTTPVGTISVSTTATFYNTSSDYRLKENVVPLANAVDRLNQLQVHRFNFIADPDTTVDGFLAHEAQDVVPECVTGTKDEVDDEGNPVYQGIDQSKIVPLLTAALQEALAKIEALEQRLTDAGL